MRAIIQDMIINPNLSLEAASQIRLEQMRENTDYPLTWHELSAIERLILQALAQGQNSLYSADFRQQAAQKLGIDEVKVSTMQSNIRKLKRKELITQNSANMLQLNNPLLQIWITENTD
ncbi:hypothetical protein [Wielerella bovis]|uniref:hypothetical protein n=1 Tax=Wielerella bovis TaxID=2917790 RepID=UPI003211EF68